MKIEIELQELDPVDIGKIIEIVFIAKSGHPVKDERELEVIKHYGKPILMIDTDMDFSWIDTKYFHMPSVGGSSEAVEKELALGSFANEIAKEFRYNKRVSYYEFFRAATGWEVGGKLFYEEDCLKDILGVAHPDEPPCSHKDGNEWSRVDSRLEGVGVVDISACKHCGAAFQESDLENLDEGFLRSFANSCAPKFKCYGDRVSDLDWNVYKYIPL